MAGNRDAVMSTKRGSDARTARNRNSTLLALEKVLRTKMNSVLLVLSLQVASFALARTSIAKPLKVTDAKEKEKVRSRAGI